MQEYVPRSYTSTKLTVLGGGPAGATAAIQALHNGVPVQLVERSRFPRHKVCGEFLSPDIIPALERLGLVDEFLFLQPATVRRMALHFGSTAKHASLPEPAYGLSRYSFDNLLMRSAISAGAEVVPATNAPPSIIATGRRSTEPRGQRLFGFKAHYDGPCDDAVELYFFDHFYVGVNCVEQGRTNVCGLGPEDALRRVKFSVDELLGRCAPLRARIAPLQRTMDWMITGPLQFGNCLHDVHSRPYPAGDALSFVDPFTGSGLLSAVVTGTLAGLHASRHSPMEAYLADCRKALSKPFGVSAVLRRLAFSRAAEYLVGLVPGELLFRWTRPRLVL